MNIEVVDLSEDFPLFTKEELRRQVRQVWYLFAIPERYFTRLHNEKDVETRRIIDEEEKNDE